MRCRIAGLTVNLDIPEWMLHKSFIPFTCGGGSAELYFGAVFEKSPPVPAGARQVAGAPLYSVFEKDGSTYILHSDEDVPSCIVASNDWSDFRFYLSPGMDWAENAELAENNLFMSLRRVFAAALLERGGLLIHCAALEYAGRGIVFSAKSETGKSTHANLWRRRYDVRILDGDCAACRITGEGPGVFGLPWCGTSSEFLNSRADLGAIVFLEQSPENSMRGLSAAEAVMRLAARCFIPLAWGDALAVRVMDAAQSLVSSVDCYLLQCRPDMEAVELVRKCVEKR